MIEQLCQIWTDINNKSADIKREICAKYGFDDLIIHSQGEYIIVDGKSVECSESFLEELNDRGEELYDELVNRVGKLGFEIVIDDYYEKVSYFENGIEIYQSKYGAVNPNEYTIL